MSILTRVLSLFLLWMALCLTTSARCLAGSKLQALRILLLCEDDSRCKRILGFLEKHQPQELLAVKLSDFKLEDAEKFDVVILDWEQKQYQTFSGLLGPRSNWSKPTLLIGSAGLNLAKDWQTLGGVGCTCLHPTLLQWDRNHPIIKSTIADITASNSNVIDGLLSLSNTQCPISVEPASEGTGWCSYSLTFDAYPDVEVVSGGINDKKAQSAAIWRQGNLMHFSFAELPDELNEIGCQLFLNSIEYISKFHEDQPIAYTPSVFTQRIVHCREVISFELTELIRSDSQRLNEILHPSTLVELKSLKSIEEKRDWVKVHKRYFCRQEKNLISIDKTLANLGKSFSDLETVLHWVNELNSSVPSKIEDAKRFLAQYVPCGPNESSDFNTWYDWFSENKDYLFASENGDYCWYIDPLAKKRGIPSAQIRGRQRSDQANH